jgi:maltose O-acetyltransferase
LKKYIFNLILSILPSSRFFKLKSLLFSSFCGEIGYGVRINQGLKIYGDSKVLIGDNSWVGINCMISSSKPGFVKIGNNCDIAPNVSFINGTHEIGNGNRRAGTGKTFDISIGDGVWIGASSTIHGGAIIGSGSIIASGSIVMKGGFPKNVILGGVPAKIIKKIND